MALITASLQRSIYGGNLSLIDTVRPEMLELMDTYWYQFPPMNPLWHGILGFVVTVLAILSLTGNGMVVFIFCSTKSLRTPSNMFVVNLAISDFLMLFCMAPAMVINCYNQTWSFGPLFCQIYGMFGSLFGSVSIWTMTFIALDRYNVIVNGLNAKPLTIKSALFCLFLVWAMSVGWTIAPVFGWNRYVPEGNMAVCGTDYLSKDWLSRSYIVLYSVFVYLMPLFIIIYSYWYIVKAVATHEKSMREQAKKMNVASLRSSEAQQTSAECKLAKIALMTISLWFMAWTPYLVTNFIGIFEISKITPLSSIWCSIFAKANATYNPIVYAISHPKYRQALRTKYPSLVCANDQNDTVSQTSGVTNVSSNETPTIA